MGPNPETSAPAAPTPAAGAEPAGQWCAALKYIGEGLLACSRPVHDGDLHYDQIDDVSWKKGRP